MRFLVRANLREGRPQSGHLRPDAESALPTCSPDTASSFLPCRIHDPDREGSVEASHAPKRPLRGVRVERLDDGQAYLNRWDRHRADTRIHGTTKAPVAARFAEERRGAPRPAVVAGRPVRLYARQARQTVVPCRISSAGVCSRYGPALGGAYRSHRRGRFRTVRRAACVCPGRVVLLGAPSVLIGVVLLDDAARRQAARPAGVPPAPGTGL